MKRNCVKRLHVFDLDHTLLRGNGSFLFGVFLFKQGYLPHLSMLSLLWAYFLHNRGMISVEVLHHRVFTKYFQGRSKEQLQELSNQFLKEKGDALFYSPAVARMQSAKDAGDEVAICSSSPDFLVATFASHFQIENWCASRYLADERGNFHQIFPLVEGKAAYVFSLQEGLKIDKKDTVAYSDSVRDLHFLQAAGESIGVQPDKKLFKICQQERWEVI